MSCKNLSEKSEEEYDLEDLADYSQQLWNKGKFMGRGWKIYTANVWEFYAEVNAQWGF